MGSSWRGPLGGSFSSWARPLSGPACASACTSLLPGAASTVLDEPSEDSICFDDGFLSSIIVSNESSEGSIMSSVGKDCALKTGKIGMCVVRDRDRGDQNLETKG